MTSGAAPAEDADEARLDEAFGRMMAALADGRSPESVVEELLTDRADLRPRLLAMSSLAARAVTRRPSPTASVPGYEVLREIGRGGMGQVLLARDVRLGRTVALKLLPRRLATSRARERFGREARAVARLQHPLIVPVYEMGEAEGQPYFSMAWVEGATLGSVIASARGAAGRTGAEFARGAGVAGACPERWSGPWWRAAAQAAADVADALSYAHGQGVIHRDVKPSNVLLRTDGFALLFDFGLADVEDEATLTQAGFLGTPHYASPEQASGDTESLDARTDVWSLGATLYEALTLEPPFPGPTTQEVLRRIRTWDPEPPTRVDATIPKDLETVVLAALEKDRERRTRDAASFAEDLRAVLAGRSVRARRAGLLERGLRSVRRGRDLTELLVEQQTRNAELRSAVLRAERNERLAAEREAEAKAALLRADEERRAADEARRRAEEEQASAEQARSRADRVVKFLQDMLASPDPARQGDADVKVSALLDRAARDAESEFAEDAPTRLRVLTVIALSLVGLGRRAEGIGLARRALALSPGAADSVAAIEAELLIASEDHGPTDPAARLDLFRRLAERARRLAGPESDVALRCDTGCILALAACGRTDEGVTESRDAIGRAERCASAPANTLLTLQNNLGMLLLRRPDGASHEEAISVLEACADARRTQLGPRHPDLFATLANLGQALKAVGRVEAAAGALLAAHAGALATLGPDHYYSATLAHNCAGVLLDLGRLAEARDYQFAAIASIPALGSAGGELEAMVRSQAARILDLLDDVPGCLAEARRAAEVWGRLGRAEAPASARVQEILQRRDGLNGPTPPG